MNHSTKSTHAPSSRLTRDLLFALVARGGSILAPLVLVPLSFRYLGPAHFAVWATATALTAMFLWADLGLGNGLLTRLTPALEKGDHAAARGLVLTAYSTLVSLSAGASVLFVSTFDLLPWDLIVGADGARGLRSTIFIVFLSWIVNIPLGLNQRVQYAAQEVTRASTIQLIGPFASVAATLAIAHLDLGKTAFIATATTGPVLANVIAGLDLARRHPWFNPFSGVRRPASVRSLLGLGVTFLCIQVMSNVAMNTDVPLVAHAAPVSELASFSLTNRIYLLIGSLITAVGLTLWPANAAALDRGEVAWVRRTTGRMALLGVSTAAASGIAIAVALPLAARLFVDDFTPDRALCLALTAQWAVVAGTSPLFMVQNAAGLLRPQLLAWPIFLTLSIPAKWQFAQSAHYALVPAGGTLLYAMTISIAALVGFKRTLRKCEERSAVP